MEFNVRRLFLEELQFVPWSQWLILKQNLFWNWLSETQDIAGLSTSLGSQAHCAAISCVISLSVISGESLPKRCRRPQFEQITSSAKYRWLSARPSPSMPTQLSNRPSLSPFKYAPLHINPQKMCPQLGHNEMQAMDPFKINGFKNQLCSSQTILS